MKLIIYSVFILTLLISPCFSWWNEGHLIIATIAKKSLMEQNKREVYKMIEDLSNLLNKFSHGKTTNLIDASVFADEIKRYGFTQGDSWHSVVSPINLPKNSEVASLLDSQKQTEVQDTENNAKNNKKGNLKQLQKQNIIKKTELKDPNNALGFLVI